MIMVVVMGFYATFSNISVISWRSVLILVDETGVPGETHLYDQKRIFCITCNAYVTVIDKRVYNSVINK